MKEASDCLDRAVHCDELAQQVNDPDSSRMLRELALQWRRLAVQAPLHKRMLSRSFPRATG